MAKLQMVADLNFNEAIYGFGAGLFFLGYVLFGIPGTLVLGRIGARRMIPAICIGWGVTSLCMMLVRNPIQFYVLRFLLGAFEAGFYPGVVLYLTYWFTERKRTKYFGIYQATSTLATVVI